MKQKKKTDRRTIYTKSVIREAFLKLKGSKSYVDITVADICREADISRGTFYLHYKNTFDVMDEVLDEALSEIKGMKDQLHPQMCGCGHKCSSPLCQFIRESRTYRCLFFDDTLSSYIIEKIYSTYRAEVVELLSEKSSLPEEQLNMIAYYQLCGCFSAAKRSGSMDEAQWDAARKVIDAFIRGGMESLP